MCTWILRDSNQGDSMTDRKALWAFWGLRLSEWDAGFKVYAVGLGSQRVLSTHMGYTYPNHKGNYYYKNHTLYHIGTLDPLGLGFYDHKTEINLRSQRALILLGLLLECSLVLFNRAQKS